MLQWSGKYAICNHLAKLSRLNAIACPTKPTPAPPKRKNGPAKEAGPF